MRILIIGGNSYTGVNLIHSLRYNHHNDLEVFVVARKPLKINGITEIIADLKDLELISKLPKNINTIIYLAQSREYRNFPDGTYDMMYINTIFPIQLANWAIENEVKRYFYFSTGNVYKDSNLPLNENSIIEPNGFYGGSKLSAEILLTSYSKHFNITSLRIFGIYGPKQEGMLIPNIIYSIKNNKEVVLNEGYGLLITPIYIDDLVKILIKLIFHKSELPLRINIAGDEQISIKDICFYTSEILQIVPNVSLSKNPAKHLVGENRLLKQFYTEDLVKFSEGIRKVINNDRI